ncbi:MAPEG family protein [Vibrio parahaemolyticus]|uniref:MAPEG family protein n=1 Tax=Vibrio mediterranei TaxID=689 RepID=UPI0040679895
MTVLILCLVVAALLPYIVKIPLAIAMHKDGGYDNRYPREQQSRLGGFGARALASHQNAFESLLLFGIAIVLAIATGTTHESVQVFAVVHIVFRMLYHLLYLLNKSTLRSLSWFIAIACSFAIMGQCLPHWA